jgi:hypothetical protein
LDGHGIDKHLFAVDPYSLLGLFFNWSHGRSRSSKRYSRISSCLGGNSEFLDERIKRIFFFVLLMTLAERVTV